MKSLKLKHLTLIIITLSVLLCTSMIAEGVIKAAYFSGGRKNNAAPSVFYHSSVSSFGYTSNYNAGIAYWNANSKVNITKTFTSVHGADVYYIGTTATSGLLGRIVPYDSSGNVASTNSYWDYTNVTMYDNQMRAQSNYTSSRINYNAAHEIGHTIKMAHVPIPTNSVMVQGWYNIPASLTSFDSGEINSKW
jgi:predicted Zn-dependent protease